MEPTREPTTMEYERAVPGRSSGARGTTGAVLGSLAIVLGVGGPVAAWNALENNRADYFGYGAIIILALWVGTNLLGLLLGIIGSATVRELPRGPGPRRVCVIGILLNVLGLVALGVLLILSVR